LTQEERKRLYSAALQDQQLFNALADEQALKELLADPDVRLRLLQALKQPGPATTGGPLPWWAWIRKPAGLAWAGGFAAAVLAIAFGTRMYQENLDRAATSVVSEEARPAAPAMQRSQPAMEPPPSAPAPELKAKEKADAAKKDKQTDKLARRERLAPASTQEARSSRSLAEHAATAAPAPQAPAGLSAAVAPAPKKNARALFYGEDSGRSGSQAKPLGLRYSFVRRGTDGQLQEVTAAMVARSSEPVRITVEATQEAYVQLLQNLGSAGTRLWWPPQETGKISLKLQAGKRNEIPMPPPAENGLITLIIRLSSKPFGPLTMQEVGMLDRFSANLLIETVSPGETTGVQEQATYVVSQDPSTSAQLAIEIPVVQ
jgi:hypothetical protein